MRIACVLASLAGLAVVLLGGASRTGLAVFTDQAGVTANTFTTGVFPVTLTTVADAYLDSADPDANSGGGSALDVSTATRTLALFDSTEIADAAAGHTLVSATLRLYVGSNDGNWGAGGDVDAHRMTDAWTEAATTWDCPIDTDTGNSAPDCASQWAGGTYNGTATDTVGFTNGTSGWVAWDVTADVAAFIAATATNDGWLIKKTDEGQGGQAGFSSREGANAPQLVLTFS
jgi:hypothetical protein